MRWLQTRKNPANLLWAKGTQKASLLYNSFMLTTFNYCPLIWMFCGKTTDNKANTVHKRVLRELLNDYTSSSEELLNRNEEVPSNEKIFKHLC